jgi:hypothetical protein
LTSGEYDQESSSIVVYKLEETKKNHYTFTFSTKGNSALKTKYKELTEEDYIADIDFIA